MKELSVRAPADVRIARGAPASVVLETVTDRHGVPWLHVYVNDDIAHIVNVSRAEVEGLY